eukprot:6209165-Pleurochrysis_carterae.AAC.4
MAEVDSPAKGLELGRWRRRLCAELHQIAERRGDRGGHGVRVGLRRARWHLEDQMVNSVLNAGSCRSGQ